ncbi:MAG TPA: SRPBCC domain-containing protein, partial [Xanthomonadales bacterium]|nr:SRPBCC domain-containing protein [Xanthomonadales bacterium]
MQRDDGRNTQVSRVIEAPRQAVYAAWLDANSLASWLPPRGMRGDVHEFDPREGGTYRMSLTYENADHAVPGKTSEDTDTVRGRFVELVPNERIVQAVEFDSPEPELAGEMTMTVTLADTN